MQTIEHFASDLTSAANAEQQLEEDELTLVATPLGNNTAAGNEKHRALTISLSLRARVASICIIVSLIASILTTAMLVRSSLADVRSMHAPEAPPSRPLSDANETDEFVTVTDVNIRSRPSGASKKVGLAEKGSRVRVIGRHKTWRQILVLQHGRDKEDPNSEDQGWIDAGTLTAQSDGTT